MQEPKVRGSDTDWTTVDIFLFSNGQHMTPPRKYHLGTEDLKKWDSTLTNLAHSHYGSVLSTVDLYTVEGRRVYTPIEISNGAAYVAVPPADTFIPAGYNDYLLRASRSREKRQSKVKNNVQLELQQDVVEGGIHDTSIEDKKEVEKVETLHEEVTSIFTPIVGDPSKQQPKVVSQYSIKNNSTIRQWGKSNNVSNQNSVMSRKQSSAVPQSTIRKTSLKNKENPVRKNLKVNTIKGTSNGSTIMSNTQSKTYSIAKTGKTTETSPRNSNERSRSDRKTEPQVSIVESISPTERTEPSVSIIVDTSPSQKIVNTEYPTFDNVIDETELIVVKKQESDLRSPIISESDKSTNVVSDGQTRLSSVVPILMPIENTSKFSAINKEVENVYKPEKYAINDTTCVQEPHDEKIKLSKKPTVDSFIAVIEKGDVVNLNLKIEVRKCEGIITTQDSKYKNSISEKSSQVNIGQEIVETISKRSKLANKVTVDEEKVKVVVIQCSCCENHNLNDILQKIDTGPVKLDDKKYVIVLPDPINDKSVERNVRPYENSIAIEKSACQVTSSLFTPVKKVYASTSIQRLTTITASQDMSTTELFSKSRNMSTTRKPYQAESELSTKNKSPQITFMHNSSQTEWHTMLLEARLHEDGRYSFYFPPIHVLKYYGF